MRYTSARGQSPWLTIVGWCFQYCFYRLTVLIGWGLVLLAGEGVSRGYSVDTVDTVDTSTHQGSSRCLCMCREYIELYGVDTLVPERKLPFTDRILHGIFRTPEGSRRGALTVRWSDCARRRRSSAPQPTLPHSSMAGAQGYLALRCQYVAPCLSCTCNSIHVLHRRGGRYKILFPRTIASRPAPVPVWQLNAPCVTSMRPAAGRHGLSTRAGCPTAVCAAGGPLRSRIVMEPPLHKAVAQSAAPRTE